MIVLDASVLIDALSGPRRSAEALRRSIESGERLLLLSMVLYEWLRGPRLSEELDAQEAILPSEQAIEFSATDAITAARLYAAVPRPRGREIDLAIAACALTRDAKLWTLNRANFEDVPDLDLVG